MLFFFFLICSTGGLVNCCPGFEWNKIENRCLPTVLGPCKDGYYGKQCRLRCPLPHFGEGCVLKCNCSEEHCHHVHGCQSPQELRGDTTLSLSYEYTPLAVELTSTQVYDKTVDTGGIQQQESTTYLLRIAVIGLSFVVTILFVSYLCLTNRMKRDRAEHEDFIIINE
uniref:Uncharacterized protein LOC111102681 n=1 Tax=Crassostrea virginica TaxID=6565 RepID=A0A8B8AKW1_CRAVI|nr:uncharacterized protein LOC111102681 [Crassostrea virginica]